MRDVRARCEKMTDKMLTKAQLHNDLTHAARKLGEGWSVLAVSKGTVLSMKQGRRLEPALALLHELRGPALEGDKIACVFADKVLGLAAFRLASLLGAEAVCGEVVSCLAVREARRRGVPIVWHRLVPAIMNMRQDGLCPMEHLAFRSYSDYEFYQALKRRH
jgi:hypothetical protein